MHRGLVAKAGTEVRAPPDAVWEALIDPAKVTQYMLGTEVVSDWRKGSPIVWKGEYQGRSFEDRGEILAIEPGQRLSYSHYSPLAGKPDVPENYHTVTVELAPGGTDGSTSVTLTQDNNGDAESRDHSAAFWQDMLERLKGLLERQIADAAGAAPSGPSNGNGVARKDGACGDAVAPA
jgi:uncharacterized protein YndB with AHSA1/START domain